MKPKHLTFDPRIEPDRYVIYRWLTSDEGGFLARALFPQATVIEAAPSDDADDIVGILPRNAGAFHFHLNCTFTARFPRDRAKLLQLLTAGGIYPVNGGVTDISKRGIHRALAELGLPSAQAGRTGDPDEWLFVKTDLNFGGDSEWALDDAEREQLGIPSGSRVMYNPNHYQLLRRGETPISWWSDPSLVFERYISNTQHVWYRAFVNLAQVAVCEFENPSQVKKVGDSRFIRRWQLCLGESGASDEVDPGLPAAIADCLPRFLKGMKLDFGAVDILVDDEGHSFIIDLNTTPAYNHPVPGLIQTLSAVFDEGAP